MGLQQKVIKGMMWSSVGQFSSLVISFATNIVLARLLLPEDFGCIGMLTIFTAISAAFINGGFGMALIQKKNVTDDDYSTVFLWNLFVSVFFVVILYVAAPSIASFYGIPLLKNLLRVISLDLIIVALSIVPTNQLKKNMQFKQLAMRTIVSSILSTTVAIFLAYSGWGVWSIVARQLIHSIVILIMLWTTTTWRPSFRFSHASFKEMFGFGSMMLLSNLFGTLYTNINGLLIGKVFSSTQLGYYSQAKKLEEVPSLSLTAVINEVSFSAFSSIQDQKRKLRFGVRNNINAVAFFCFPMFFCLIFVAPTLIPLLFGEKWTPSVPMFQILCMGSMLYTLNGIYESAIKALGKGKTYFTIYITNRVIGLTLIFVGIRFGINGMLTGMAIASYISLAINMIVNRRLLDYEFKEQTKDLLPYYLLSVIVLALSYFLSSRLIINSIVNMVVTILFYLTVYLVSAYVLKFPAVETYFGILKNRNKHD